MFLAIMLHGVIIPKVSAFCSIGVDKTESFGIINSWLLVGYIKSPH